MGLGARLFAATYDRASARIDAAGFEEHRARLLAAASGRVLEIGAATGLNLDRYPESARELVLAEPDPNMAKRLERRAAASDRAVRVVRAPAERLPFPDGSFDTVVSSLVLCTVPDQPRALAEVRRVLAPGGRLLFLEHVRSREPRLARWQDRLNPVWRRLVAGCNCNRDTLGAIAAAGFRLEEVEESEFPRAAPVCPLVRPLVRGSAVPA